jgi:hypothetical protein
MLGIKAFIFRYQYLEKIEVKTVVCKNMMHYQSVASSPKEMEILEMCI